jgi:hypothetical protein
MISISTIGLANDVIPDSELVTRRGFFTNTDLFRGVRFFINDPANESKELVITIYFATNTTDWSVLDAKDIFTEIILAPTDSDTIVLVADLCFDEVIWAGRSDGVMSNGQYYCEAISGVEAPEINGNLNLKYHSHVVLPGYDHWGRASGSYRECIECRGGQIDIELQLALFPLINGTRHKVQEMLIDQFIYENGFSPDKGQTVLPVESNTEKASGFEFVTLFLFFPSMFLIRKLLKKK